MLLASMGCPSNVALPSVGSSKPVSIFMVVDLPQPLEPKKPKISPFGMVKVTLSTEIKSPNFLVNPLAIITGGSLEMGWNGGIRKPFSAPRFSGGNNLM